MEKKEVKENQFIQLKGEGLEGFGIVACEGYGTDKDENGVSEQTACLMLGDMNEDFGTWDNPLSRFEEVDEVTVRANLAIMAEDKEKYRYFIIQLNDIPELKDFHIEEDDFLRNVRTTNDVCLYWAEQKAQ
jgi:hypothetical protein